MVIRLTAKLAELVNGVDLSDYSEGDIVELPSRDAQMLIAEGWAERVNGSGSHWYRHGASERAVAAERHSRE